MTTNTFRIPHRSLVTLPGLLLGLLIPTLVSAQEPPEGANGRRADLIRGCNRLPEGFTVALDIVDEELYAVARVIGCMTGKRFSLPEQLKGEKITISSPTRLTSEGAYNAFLAALESKGYTVDESLRVVEREGRDAIITGGPCKPKTNEHQIDREVLDEQLADLDELASQARISSHERDGRTQGYKLVGVRPGSLYSHIGVRSGDILKRVNGEEVNSFNKVLGLFEKLKDSGSVSLEIERRGKPVTLRCSVK